MKLNRIVAALAFVTATAMFTAGPLAAMQAAPAKQGVHKLAKHKHAAKVARKKRLKAVKGTRLAPRKLRSHAFYRMVQKLLNKSGARLKVDGKWGRDSRQALTAYQQHHKLKPTGRINKATRARLGL